MLHYRILTWARLGLFSVKIHHILLQQNQFAVKLLGWQDDIGCQRHAKEVQRPNESTGKMWVLDLRSSHLWCCHKTCDAPSKTTFCGGESRTTDFLKRLSVALWESRTLCTCITWPTHDGKNTAFQRPQSAHPFIVCIWPTKRTFSHSQRPPSCLILLIKSSCSGLLF